MEKEEKEMTGHAKENQNIASDILGPVLKIRTLNK